MATKTNERGIDELRKLVNMANWTREDAFDGLDAYAIVRLLQACRKLDLETLPDQLTEDEQDYAIEHGKVSTECLTRLYDAQGEAHTGSDWEGR